jgi:hypothetical protein
MPRYTLFVVLLYVLLGGAAALASPCSVGIDREQAKIDAALDQQAGAGKTGVESTAATDSRQPTPASIAAAERALGEGVSIRDALASLTRARKADDGEDAAACQAELVAARKFLRE